MKIAVAQFEPKDGAKDYNLGIIHKLTAEAKSKGANLISFHEMSITAYAFTNPIGYDGIHLKNGNSMIIDPYGEILSEIKSFDNTITIANISKDKIPLSGGYRYKNARRPALYKDIIGQTHEALTKPVWMKKESV